MAEICFDKELPLAWLPDVVASARAAGRSVSVAAPVGALPPPSPSERWVEAGEVDHWVLELPRRSAVAVLVKRALDIILASCLLLALSPALALIALAVRLTSRGPALYRWHVLGQHGRPFCGYKYRSMRIDAHQAQEGLRHLNEMDGPVFKIKDDPRVTPLGRVLRKFSVDEIPQLWNVVKGDMSLVGPRPPSRAEYSQYKLWQLRKLSVVPGMTCLWQVNGRNTISNFDDWARLDIDYIESWSLWLDMRIIAKTALAVVSGTGH